VRVELAPHRGQIGLFDGAVLAVAGIVDQDAHGAVLGFDGRDRGAHRVLVGDVQRQDARPRLG